MQKAHAIRFPLLAAGRSGAIALAASLVIALAAQIAIPVPFSPVPLTLSPLAVLLIGAFLGPVPGAIAASLYLIEGALGLPFFSQGRGGIAVLLGPTAGYLYAFPAAAFVAGLARGSVVRSSGALLAAMAIIHVGGWSWLAGAMGLGAAQAFAAGVAPFILNDVAKVALAVASVVTLRSRNRAA